MMEQSSWTSSIEIKENRLFASLNTYNKKIYIFAYIAGHGDVYVKGISVMTLGNLYV